MNSVSSSFLNIGITLAILSLSGKIPVINIWLIIIVIGFITVSLIIFSNFEDIPSKPKLILGAN